MGEDSKMNNEPVAYINVEERKLEWAKPTTWHTPTIAEMSRVPLYSEPKLKDLTDEEIHQVIFNLPNKDLDLFDFARAILRKAQEK
jgi:hypothetical protein